LELKNVMLNRKNRGKWGSNRRSRKDKFFMSFWTQFRIEFGRNFDAILGRIFCALCICRNQFHPVNNGTEWTCGGLALYDIGQFCFENWVWKLQTENRGSGGGFWGVFWGGFGGSWVNFGACNRRHMLRSKLEGEKVIWGTRGGFWLAGLAALN